MTKKKSDKVSFPVLGDDETFTAEDIVRDLQGPAEEGEKVEELPHAPEVLPPSEPRGKFTVTYYDNGISVEFDDFSLLNPRRIQTAFDFVIREWQRQKQLAVHGKRVEDVRQKEEAK